MNKREPQIVILLAVITLVFLGTAFGVASSTLAQEIEASGHQSDTGIGNLKDSFTGDGERVASVANGADEELFLPVVMGVDPPQACVPILDVPAEGATMDNGRSDGLDPLIWDFDWSNCPGATEYHLNVHHVGAANPAIDETAIGPSAFHHESASYIKATKLTNWQWKVRAKVGGSWGPWSPVNTFKVEPPNTDPPLTCVPTLDVPAEGATMDNGRYDGLDPLIWDFDWSNCPGATEYHLYVHHVGSANPTINETAIATSAYHHEPGGYIGATNLTNWQWKVRARVAGSWGPWSPNRTFDVEPPNTDPAPTCVPTLQAPAEGATMDNGRYDGLDPLIWDFDWSNCPGATEYHLYVHHVGSPNPTINETAIATSAYHHEPGGYIGTANLTNWQWKVRAKVGGNWGPWSPIRTFKVEPPNTDPP